MIRSMDSRHTTNQWRERKNTNLPAVRGSERAIGRRGFIHRFHINDTSSMLINNSIGFQNGFDCEGAPGFSPEPQLRRGKWSCCGGFKRDCGWIETWIVGDWTESFHWGSPRVEQDGGVCWVFVWELFWLSVYAAEKKRGGTVAKRRARWY